MYIHVHDAVFHPASLAMGGKVEFLECEVGGVSCMRSKMKYDLEGFGHLLDIPKALLIDIPEA